MHVGSSGRSRFGPDECIGEQLAVTEMISAAVSGRKEQTTPIDRIFGILPLRGEKNSKGGVWAATRLQ